MSLTFYMHCNHEAVASSVMRSLEIYLRVVGQDSLGWYRGKDGLWRELDSAGWALTHEEIRGPRFANVDLRGRTESLSYSFSYRGKELEDPLSKQWGYDPTSAVSFLLPTEFLEEHGPGRVRELALELGAELPFSSGQTGLAFHMMSWLSSNTPVFREKSLLHPGLDLVDLERLSNRLGTKIRGPAWLTFLGEPVLSALGGAASLRERLHSPATSVQDLGGNRALVTLGPWPEAGELTRGDTLPHYRELARVLEPWLYMHQGGWGNLTEAEIRRWERRFLD
ncbi:DUF3396 domain-containing protein [Myxococcus sp. RHSTA-1-4]|uniref:DUF3396 domain-containing protein n=1 Tax=Myxococcus sp. RHSTA-1-4 TaxID=2874601 RepID=UPI001CC09263